MTTKALTLNQKIIIDNLVNEFQKLNKTVKNTEFNIINFSEINDEYNRIKKGEKQLKIYNDGINELKKEIIRKYIDQINTDFKNGNIPLEAVKCMDDSFKIQYHVGSSNHCIYGSYDFTFRIEIAYDWDKTEFGNELRSDFRYRIRTRYDELGIYYHILDECIKSKDFNEKLMRLYNSISENEISKYLWN